LVRNHAHSIVACDLLVLVTARFRTLYVFLWMEAGTRRIVSCNSPPSPRGIGEAITKTTSRSAVPSAKATIIFTSSPCRFSIGTCAGQLSFALLTFDFLYNRDPWRIDAFLYIS
jgi:hypothetical protein